METIPKPAYDHLIACAKDLNAELAYRFNPDEPELVWGSIAMRRKQVLWRDEFTCQYCGATDTNLIIEHIVPRSRVSGINGDAAYNLTTACEQCNKNKATHTVDEWRVITLHRDDGDPQKYPINPWIGKHVRMPSMKRGIVTSILGSNAYVVEYPTEIHHRLPLQSLEILGSCDDLYNLKQKLPIPLKHIDVRAYERTTYEALQNSARNQPQEELLLFWEITVGDKITLLHDDIALDEIEALLDRQVLEFTVKRRRMTQSSFNHLVVQKEANQ